jgi:hypothetical protein
MGLEGFDLTHETSLEGLFGVSGGVFWGGGTSFGVQMI